MALFSKAALLMRDNPRGFSYQLTNGYSTANSESEAIGDYYKYLRAEFSDYNIKEVLVLEIPQTDINHLAEKQDGTSERSNSTNIETPDQSVSEINNG